MRAFQSLSESEMEIMKVIWEMATPVTTTQMLEVFAHKGWKAQTMSTFLTRLVEKGVLTAARKGKSNLYTPAITLEEYRQLEARMSSIPCIMEVFEIFLPPFMVERK